VTGRWSTLNWLVALALLAAALLQWNDDDGLHWALLYGGCAGSALQAGRWRGDWIAPTICGCVAWIWFAVLAPQAGGVGPTELFQSMQALDGRVEFAREACGLAFAGSWMVVVLWRRDRY